MSERASDGPPAGGHSTWFLVVVALFLVVQGGVVLFLAHTVKGIATPKKRGPPVGLAMPRWLARLLRW